jgi:hypothetical protein
MGCTLRKIGDGITVAFNIIQLDTGIAVVCKDCGKTLDRVPDERTACTNAGAYILHKCDLKTGNTMSLRSMMSSVSVKYLALQASMLSL